LEARKKGRERKRGDFTMSEKKEKKTGRKGGGKVLHNVNEKTRGHAVNFVRRRRGKNEAPGMHEKEGYYEVVSGKIGETRFREETVQ